MDLGMLDSLTFYQDCIDFDMKSDYDRVLSNSSFNYDDSLSLNDDNMMSMMDPLNSGLWLNSNSNHHLDFIGGDIESAIMVNPNSVIPSSAEAAEKKIKEEPIIELSPPKEIPALITIKKEETVLEPQEIIIKSEPIEEPRKIEKKPIEVTKVEELKPIQKAIRLSDLLSQTSSNSQQKTEMMTVRVTMPSSVPSVKTTVTSRTVPVSFVNNSIAGHYKIVRPKQQIKPIQSRINGSKGNDHLGLYPRPTYSYSCLIAMALKNSSTGSLPVSEIYNFMCKHFPYFKTASSGWKNSVRHNLSLNKCFEKIEKPIGSTGAPRKGCLWTMNPSKIAKMDDEMQKWSRKDPSAIKRAMLNPEHLDALERGEMNDSYDRRDSYYLDDEEEEEIINQEMTTSEEEDRIVDSDIEEESDGDSRNDKDDSPYQLITFGLDDLANLNDIGNDIEEEEEIEESSNDGSFGIEASEYKTNFDDLISVQDLPMTYVVQSQNKTVISNKRPYQQPVFKGSYVLTKNVTPSIPSPKRKFISRPISILRNI
ncbi:forkhead box protein P1 [Adelges cooleyi]|uniref:forkhead box protein P1 n=1 Tax=Adelges cooleyi TaxID=133065 RepID=UPI00217F80C6|nr:forkhead box protein P1 [Adelges cooleyi]